MSNSFVVYAAIPDDGMLDASRFAEMLCTQFGGTCNWECYDSERVIYWFTEAETRKAFIGYCAFNRWKVG